MQPGPVLRLPSQPLPVVRPASGSTLVAAPAGAPRQLQPGQQIVIRQVQPGQPAQIQVQQPPQQQQQQLQQQQPQQQQPQQQQPQQQQGAGSQQVQLRVSNDEANRTFCISWLRATYESASSSNIQHEVNINQSQ